MKKKIFILAILFIITFFIFKESSGPNISQNGISTNQLADDIFQKYDLNSDKKLDVATESFLRTRIKEVNKTESRGLLFTDADGLGNKDGSVSKAELLTLLQSFDTDGDGEITSYKDIFNSLFNGKSEWFEFDSKYAEKYKYDEK